MIQMIVDRVQVSLMSQHRLVVLRDLREERYLPIWIGQFESEAITLELQKLPRERPLTHDLLKATIAEMGGAVRYIFINKLSRDVFYAQIAIDAAGLPLANPWCAVGRDWKRMERQIWLVCGIMHSGVVARLKRVLDLDLGGYRPMAYAADWDLFQRMVGAGMRIEKRGDYTFRLRDHGEQTRAVANYRVRAATERHCFQRCPRGPRKSGRCRSCSPAWSKYQNSPGACCEDRELRSGRRAGCEPGRKQDRSAGGTLPARTAGSKWKALGDENGSL